MDGCDGIKMEICESSRKLEGTSKYDHFRDLLRCALFDRKPLDYVEDQRMMKDYHLRRERKHHLTPDHVLKQKYHPGKDKSGEQSQKDGLPKGQAPPPYTETANALDQMHL